ncbi:D-alanyl-D-alanine carboxypeptidase [uncultured Caudovirales phage]|jgi:peptidoglycan L-alanyl-D-glutamate endopeptidase CwlK|uniref:D-alanyl-D-alanine carboxypeptidase n=1 Tax=uncultured Caudovirales phage TaxID=2100421 RepID=A0A6J5MZU2_9CAUD|nr:D-alanyl-D-alanine carboxypeptidase [uncultured Caudovirales phage]
MINSRSLLDLDGDVQDLAHKFISHCDAVGIDLLVTSTYRDFACQAATYAQGRSTPGTIVTKAKAGQSWHNWRRALDVVPLRNGKPIWDVHEPIWAQIGLIGQEVGFEWAGSWRHFPEFPHFQHLDGRTLDDMLAKYPQGL